MKKTRAVYNQIPSQKHDHHLPVAAAAPVVCGGWVCGSLHTPDFLGKIHSSLCSTVGNLSKYKVNGLLSDLQAKEYHAILQVVVGFRTKFDGLSCMVSSTRVEECQYLVVIIQFSTSFVCGLRSSSFKWSSQVTKTWEASTVRSKPNRYACCSA